MLFSTFDDILVKTFSGRAFIILFVILLIAISTSIRVIYYCRTKNNHGFSVIDFVMGRKNRKAKLSTKQQIGMNLSVLVILTLFCLYWICPAYRDVRNQQYIQIRGQYKRTEISSEGNLFSNGYVYVYKDGKRIDLVLPANWTPEEFPLGEFSGTIWYSKETKMILSLSID